MDLWLELRHRYGIFRLESQTSVERRRDWAREETRLFTHAINKFHNTFPLGFKCSFIPDYCLLHAAWEENPSSCSQM